MNDRFDKYFFPFLLTIFVYLQRTGAFVTSPSYLCPDWCDCIATKESNDGNIKLTCEWPNIPDIERIRFLLPIENNHIVRLNIKCKLINGQAGKFVHKKANKLHRGLFAHLHKLQHLQIVNCPLDGNVLPNGFSSGLQGLRSLHLSSLNDPDSNSAFIVEPGALENLKNLEKLTITSTNIDRFLPKADFCEMDELKMLNMSGNLLRKLDDLGCAENQKNQLIIMDLSYNKITKMADFSLKAFQSLRVLRLNHNFLRKIPPGLFASNQQLKDLAISHNRLSTIDDLPINVHNLDLSANNLHFLPATLTHHQSVQLLDLSKNFIDLEGPLFFESNPQLLILNLSHNNVRFMSGNYFGPNTIKLVELDLSDNNLQLLEPDSLKNLVSLKRLNLARNNMNILPNASLSGLIQLMFLSLENCSLTHIDSDAFSDLPNLDELKLNENRLTFLPAGLPKLKNLRSLNVSGNGLTTISRHSFSEMENLMDLDVSRNRLTSIDRLTFARAEKLENLDLSSNQIQQVEPNALDGVSNLIYLNIENNLIKDINGIFANLNRLKYLGVSKNRLSHIDLALLPPNLHKLDASNNAISQITMFFAGIVGRLIENLTEIDFSDNKLEKLTADMIPLSTKVVTVARNRLQKLDKNIFGEKIHLERLDLSQNQLQTIEEISKTRQIKVKLDISKNPLLCDCNLEWLTLRHRSPANQVHTAEMDEIGYSIENLDRLQCRTLKNPEYRPWKDVEREEFLCPYEIQCLKDCLCCEFESCDCKNVCPINCSCLADNRLNINEVTCSRTWSSLNDSNTQSSHESHLKTIPMHATLIRLDGLNLPKLNRNAFFGRYRLKKLYLNNSGLAEIASKTFSGLTSLDTLDLSNNRLLALSGDEFYFTSKLEILFLHNNFLQSLGQLAFENLPGLELVTLHGNRFEGLPAVLTQLPTTPALTLGQNPWKCDCNHEQYPFSNWLVAHANSVLDNRDIYCYENLTNQSENSTTILSVLPPTNGVDVVKVNVWTFVAEINRTFCIPGINLPGNKTTNDEDLTKPIIWYRIDSSALFIFLAVGIMLAMVLLLVIMWRLKCKLHGNNSHKYFDEYRRSVCGINVDCSYNNSASSMARHSTTKGPFASIWRNKLRQSSAGNGDLAAYCLNHSPISVCAADVDFNCGVSANGTCSTNTANPTPTIPMPVMEYDAFLSYSSFDEPFVLEHIASRLEHEHGYKLCLLYREFPRNVSVDRQHVDNELIDAMERSRRVLTVYSKNFIDNEWEQVRMRTAYQWLAHCQYRKSIIIVLDDTPPVDHALAKYMRMNLRYRYHEKMFWDNILVAMPMNYHSVVNRDVRSAFTTGNYCTEYFKSKDGDLSSYDSIKENEDVYSNRKFSEKVRYQTDLFGRLLSQAF